jgi:type IV secretion system protein VirD4
LLPAEDEPAVAVPEEARERQRHPGLAEEARKIDRGQEAFGLKLFDDDNEAPAEKRALDRARGLNPIGRAHAMNVGESRDRDDIPDF